MMSEQEQIKYWRDKATFWEKTFTSTSDCFQKFLDAHYKGTKIKPKGWTELSEDEIEAIDKAIDPTLPINKGKMLFARALEAKLKEKNYVD